jgi:hypothetical protein
MISEIPDVSATRKPATSLAGLLLALSLVLTVASCSDSAGGEVVPPPTPLHPTASDAATPAALVPSAPFGVTLSGVLPDLRTPVPPGQGETGRITVEWRDASSNETGFRIYELCAGQRTTLAEVPANESRYGPLQICRPGNIGVAAYNASGVSDITWAQ